MKLQRITIREFRQFAGQIVIDGLEPGLNLFTGPNEAGKSTIAEALRTVFLERYKASHLKDLLPWGKASGQPAVEVAFELDGVPCTLSKQFVARQRCDLRIGNEVYGEDEAEDRLAALLGFARATRGAMKAEFAGVPGLLWVQQGATQELREPSGHAALYLRDALGQLSGGSEAGGEDALIGAIGRELRQLLTARTQRATGPLAEAEQKLAALVEERAALEAQRRQFDDNVTRLATLQETFEDVQRKRPWEALEQQAAEAAKRAEAATALERDMQQIAQQVALKEAELALSLQQEQTAAQFEASVVQDREQLARAQEAARVALDAHAQAASEVARYQQQHDEASRALDIANIAVSVRDLHSQIALLDQEIARLTDAIAAADAAHGAVLAATREAAALEIDERALQQLQTLETKLGVLRAKKDAAMTRIEYRLSGEIVVGESRVSGEGVLRFDDEATIGLPGLGELRVVPGASDLNSVRRELAEFEARHAQLLQTLGVATLDAGQTRLAQWQALVAQRQTQQKILAVHAPQGIDALRTALADNASRRDHARERLAALPDVSAAVGVNEARTLAQAARVALDAANKALAAASERRDSSHAAGASLAAQLQRKEAQLQDPAARERRAQCQAQIVEQRAHVTTLVAQRDERARELAVVRNDDPAAEAKRYRVSAELARSEQHERQLKIAALRSQLETVGASALGERLAGVNASLEQTQRRHAELKLRADALSLLDKVLVEERDAAVAQLQAPLTERLGHYLKRLFPQAALALGDDLSPASLARDGRLDALDALSFGTREQMGILTRLAYADLLKAAGRPTLLMLDDAAVHTDRTRRDALKRALLDAATRHQILLFTCHPELWDDLGIRQRALDDLKAVA